MNWTVPGQKYIIPLERNQIWSSLNSPERLLARLLWLSFSFLNSLFSFCSSSWSFDLLSISSTQELSSLKEPSQKLSSLSEISSPSPLFWPLMHWTFSESSVRMITLYTARCYCEIRRNINIQYLLASCNHCFSFSWTPPSNNWLSMRK